MLVVTTINGVNGKVAMIMMIMWQTSARNGQAIAVNGQAATWVPPWST